ncbi:hypothetical protein CALCODRAFT_512382 [Calocera cornea HHB12733]|uniref:Apple domain-containing protein n=1 Tax=Calocera cornea HHB12733 TaxID=1353952 RepID=A0A165D258_9BASI|nr:hypothetical protein CALCODRAFT_512382 [Calocera cornea HHB12733]
MFFRTALLPLAWLCVVLATLATALVPKAVPRALRQATRDGVVQRMALSPDGTWSANRAKRSGGAQTDCGLTVAGGGTCACGYTISCASMVPTGNTLIGPPLTLDSFADCVRLCDSSLECGIVSYQLSTGNCAAYGNTFVTLIPNTDYETAVLSAQCDGLASCLDAYPPAGF